MHPQRTTDPGFCECGCGRRTRIAPKTRREHGWVKGEPQRYLKGHSPRRWHLDAYVVNENGCWVWQGHHNTYGYPVYAADGRSYHVHRLLYEREYGPLPEGWVPDHHCPGGPNRSCVNPAHMRPLTRADNSRWKKSTILDWVKVREIRGLAGTMANRAIAKQFGISESHVSDVILRKIWRE